MVGASKILTVSYGTFSCTLEGFDEPFSTMKAIAEYFRDLAADDRYFGAEPPTPDAQMLHQIAEREIHRRVEAKIQENGVVLRADGTDRPEASPVAAGLAAPAPAAEEVEDAIEDVSDATAPARTEPARTEPAQTEPAQTEPAATPSPEPIVEDAAPAADVSAPLEADSVAAKLLRIRAAVQQARDNSATSAAPAAGATPAAIPAKEELAATQPVEDEAEDEDAAAESAAAPAAQEAASAPLDAAQAEEEHAAAAEHASDDDAEDEDSAEAEAVSLSNVMAALSAGRAQDENAEAEAADEPHADEATASQTETSFAQDEDEEPEAPQAQPEDAAAEPEAAQVAEPLARARARVIKVRRVDPNSAPHIVRDEDEQTDEDAAKPEAAETDEPAAQAAETEAEAEVDTAADETHAPETATSEAASTIEDSPAEAAAPSSVDEDYEDEGDLAADEAHADATEEAADTGLSPEAEAELQAELAAVEREVEAHRRADRGGRSILGQSTDDDSMSRLMRQTENQMEGAENRRRLSTIAHLKAAVAAREADRELGGEEENPDEALRSYRDDLEKVVRPRRPVAAEGTGNPARRRPVAAAERPAPLVLVSEQRIDRPSDIRTGARPIRPRRISSSNLAMNHEVDDQIEDHDNDGNVFADSQSFAEFADRIGATSLPDVLEAAAAYSNCVEGMENFTRPQIMRFAATVGRESESGSGDSFSREAALRSFGALLREGKIKKVKRGQFAISQSSRFIQEARKIAR